MKQRLNSALPHPEYTAVFHVALPGMYFKPREKFLRKKNKGRSYNTTRSDTLTCALLKQF